MLGANLGSLLYRDVSVMIFLSLNVSSSGFVLSGTGHLANFNLLWHLFNFEFGFYISLWINCLVETQNRSVFSLAFVTGSFRVTEENDYSKQICLTHLF